MNEVVARPGEIVIENETNVIICYALGSSLGICLYDAHKQIGGFVNSLLPVNPNQKHDLKYVDNAIEALYRQMQEHGCEHKDICAKIIGGAHLFIFQDHGKDHDIGKANIKVAYNTLMALHIPIASEDVGDTYGRTLYFHMEDGSVYIETSQKKVYPI